MSLTKVMSEMATYKRARVAATTIRTVNAKLYEIVSAEDYGFVAGNPSAASANKTALLAAMNDGYIVNIPAGTFYLEGDISFTHVNTILCGASISTGYADSLAATTLVFTSGSTGFLLLGTQANPSGPTDTDGSGIMNMVINGHYNNHTMDVLIEFEGTKYFKNLALENFKLRGFYGSNWVNSTVIDECSTLNFKSKFVNFTPPTLTVSGEYLGIGLEIAGQYSTAYSIQNSRFRASEFNAIVRAANVSSFSNCVFEGSPAAGLLLENAEGTYIVRLKLDTCHFEANGTNGSINGFPFALDMRTAAVTSFPKNIYVINSKISTSAGSLEKVLNISSGYDQVNFVSCGFEGQNSSAIIIAPSATNIRFSSCDGMQYAGANINMFSTDIYNRKTSTTGIQVSNFISATGTSFVVGIAKTIAITLDSNLFSIYFNMVDVNTGFGVFYALDAYSSTEIKDNAGIADPSATPAGGKWGIYPTFLATGVADNIIYLYNNTGVPRTIKLNVIGAQVVEISSN